MKRILLIALAIIAISLVIIGAGIGIFYAWTDWVGARHWRAVEAELHAKGDPATIVDIVPKPIPDEVNFAAAPIFAEIATEPDRTKWRISQIQEFHPASYRGSEIAGYARRIDPKFNGSDIDAARVIFAQIAKWKPLLDEVRLASQRPETQWKIDYYDIDDDLPQIQVLLKLAKVLAVEAKAYTTVGDGESAFRDTKLILNLSRRAASPPLLITHLICLSIAGLGIDAIRFGLERHAWTDAQLARIQDDLAGLSLRTDLIDSLRFERANVNDNILAINRVPIEAGADLMYAVQKAANTVIGANSKDLENPEHSMALHIFGFLWSLRPAGWAREDQAAASQEFERLIGIVKTHGTFFPSSISPAPGNLMTQLLSTLRTPCAVHIDGMLKSTIERSLYAETLLNETCAACAIERYRLAHGTLPPSLAALCPEFLSSVPLDPMSGQPLRYLPSSDSSYVLYSVGWNQKDDGGSEQGGRTYEALDWVWKIGSPS